MSAKDATKTERWCLVAWGYHALLTTNHCGRHWTPCRPEAATTFDSLEAAQAAAQAHGLPTDQLVFQRLSLTPEPATFNLQPATQP